MEERAVYLYVQRSESATHSFDARRLEGELKALEEKLDYAVVHIEKDDRFHIYARAMVVSSLRTCAMVDLLTGESASAQYVGRARQQAFRIPNLTKLENNQLEMRAFLDYGVNLFSASAAGAAADPCALGLQNVRRWVDFILDNPLCEKGYREGLTSAVRAALPSQALKIPREQIQPTPVTVITS